LEPLNPISGVGDQQLVTLVEAAKRFCSLVSVDSNVQVALDYAEYRLKKKGQDPNGLSVDEMAAIHLYTQESKFYSILNATLRSVDRDRVKPFFPYLRLMQSAMSKLPKVTRPIWRGVKENISESYPRGTKFYWWGFSSASTDLELLKSEQFLGPTSGTLFNIQSKHGVSIANYSAIPSESEVLLPPGIRFIVNGAISVGGAFLIEVEESGIQAYS